MIIPKALLKFYIQKGIIFNGILICESLILEAIKSKKNMAPIFPYLITKLCERASVSMPDYEDKIPRMPEFPTLGYTPPPSPHREDPVTLPPAPPPAPHPAAPRPPLKAY